MEVSVLRVDAAYTKAVLAMHCLQVDLLIRLHHKLLGSKLWPASLQDLDILGNHVVLPCSSQG